MLLLIIYCSFGHRPSDWLAERLLVFFQHYKPHCFLKHTMTSPILHAEQIRKSKNTNIAMSFYVIYNLFDISIEEQIERPCQKILTLSVVNSYFIYPLLLWMIRDSHKYSQVWILWPKQERLYEEKQGICGPWKLYSTTLQQPPLFAVGHDCNWFSGLGIPFLKVPNSLGHWVLFSKLIVYLGIKGCACTVNLLCWAAASSDTLCCSVWAAWWTRSRVAACVQFLRWAK